MTMRQGAQPGNRNRCGHPKPAGAGSFKPGHPYYGGAMLFQSGEQNPAWKGNDISYGGAHFRARRALAGHPCAECGSVKSEAALKAGRATTFDERVRVWFSPDPADYLPLCRPCHRAYDRANRKVA